MDNPYKLYLIFATFGTILAIIAYRVIRFIIPIIVVVSRLIHMRGKPMIGTCPKCSKSVRFRESNDCPECGHKVTKKEFEKLMGEHLGLSEYPVGIKWVFSVLRELVFVVG